jgi:hypothetical protein
MRIWPFFVVRKAVTRAVGAEAADYSAREPGFRAAQRDPECGHACLGRNGRSARGMPNAHISAGPVSPGWKGAAMTTLSRFGHQLLAAAVCAAAIAGMASSRAGAAEVEQSIERADREAALRVFHMRVEEYAALHRHLEGPLPPLTTTRNMLKNYIAQQRLASAIRKARAGVQQGAIFSPDVATVFRALIGDALEGQDVDAFLRELHSEHPGIEDVRPVINEPLPAETTHEMPIVLLHVLPALPEDVEYRIVHRDLVLWDIHANLVIDYVPSVFGQTETTF